MIEYTAVRNKSRRPTSPAALLAETVIPALGLKKGEIADALGVTRQSLHDVLTEKAAVSPKMAVRLGKLCGNGAGVWLRMQAACDLWDAEREVDVSNIPTLKSA